MYSINCTNIGRALRDEWAIIATSRRSQDATASWSQAEPALEAFTSPAAILEAIETAPLEDSITVTQAVVRLAEDHELAARLLIQVMVPTIASECYRSLRVLRQIHLQYQSSISPTGSDVADLVLGSTAEAVACYAGRSLSYPLRTIRRRMIEIIIQRRTKLINTQVGVRSLAGLQADGASWHNELRPKDREPSWDPGESFLAETMSEPSPAELLAETLDVAVDLGIVSASDAGLVWATRYHQQTSLELGDGDKREAERLRRRRSRAQQRLIAHRSDLLASGIAV